MHQLFIIGLVILIGFAGGHAAHRTGWIPRITGYLVVGLLFGPSGLGLLSSSMLETATLPVDITLGLILFAVGTRLDLRHLRELKPPVLLALLESGLAFVLIVVVLRLLEVGWLLTFAAAAIGVSSSPAIILLVMRELKASGPLSDLALTVTACNNLFSFLLFTAILPFIHAAGGATYAAMFGKPVYILFGSVALGLVSGIGLGYLRRALHAEAGFFVLVVGAILLVIGAAKILGLSPLLAQLMLGAGAEFFLRESAAEHTLTDQVDFGQAGDIFFLILFVVSGAKLHLNALLQGGIAVLAFVAARGTAKLVATSLWALFNAGNAPLPVAAKPTVGQRTRHGFLLGLIITPLAGMAIGLSRTTQDIAPQFGDELAGIVLGGIVIFETIGPFLTELALKKSGEVSPEAFDDLRH